MLFGGDAVGTVHHGLRRHEPAHLAPAAAEGGRRLLGPSPGVPPRPDQGWSDPRVVALVLFVVVTGLYLLDRLYCS